MNRQLILLDLDGTVIDTTTHQVPVSALKTIDLLKKQGHIVAIATGRHPSHFQGIDARLGIETYVAANGRLVVIEGALHHIDPISAKLVEQFSKAMNQSGIDVGYESPDAYVLGSQKTPWVHAFHQYYDLGDAPVIVDFYKNHPILQMVIFGDKLPIEHLIDTYPHLSFNPSGPYGIDVNAKGELKEKGAEVLRQYYGISRNDIIAVGDGYNDLGLIRYAHVGIAMGNACEALKNVADIITKSASEDGLEHVFKQLGLI